MHINEDYVDIVNTKSMKAVNYFVEWWRQICEGVSWKQWKEENWDRLVFCNSRGKKLRSASTKPYLNLYALLNGCDPKSLAVHSFRLGSATEMASNNACDRAIRAHGRWTNDSSAFAAYIRPDLQTRRAIRRKFL